MLSLDSRTFLGLHDARAHAPAVCYAGAFSSEECARIEEAVADARAEPAAVGAGARFATELRRSDLRWLHLDAESSWVYERFASYLELANSTTFGFDLVGFEGPLQYAEYRKGEFFEWHQDMGAGQSACRKLTATCVLSRATDHEGGGLELPSGVLDGYPAVADALARPDQGSLIVFPSYQLHRVSPVISGVRRSLVAWVVGSPFR